MILLSAWLASLLLFNAESRASDYSDSLQAADKFYQNGECANAVTAYKKIYYDPLASSADRDLVVFRTSYCYVQLEQYEAAATGFQLLLNTHPEEDEVRLRLAQTLMNLNRPLEARALAVQVHDPKFIEEAMILVAQEDLALGEAGLAIQDLSSVNVSKNWWPVYCYWLGVAYYQSADNQRAESYFSLAISKSAPNFWVVSEAKNWLSQIKREKAWAHGSVTFGYFSDGNVAQESVLSTDNNGVPTQTGPNPSSYYTDTGFLVSTGLSFRLVNEKKWNLYSSFSFSSPYYNSYSNYNNQVYAASLASAYKISSFWTSDFTLKYIDSRYENAYYQDYLALNAGLGGPITRKLFFRFEIPYTIYVNTKFDKSYGVNMNVHYYGFSFASFFLGETFLDTSGPFATYGSSSGSAYLLTGSMFNNYESSSTYFGVTVPLPLDFHVTGQLSSGVLNYKGESFPQGTTQAASANRTDHSLTYSLEVGGPILSNLWFGSLSYTYTNNQSNGVQGIASSNLIANYNYTRPYWLLSSTLAF